MPSGLECREHDVGRDRRAPEHVVADGIGNRRQHRTEARAHGRLAHASGAHRCVGVGQVERGVMHAVGRHVHDGKRLVVVEAAGERHAVVLVVHGLLAEGVADAEAAAAQHLSSEASRVDHRAHVGHGRVFDEAHRAGFNVDFHLGEAHDVGVRVAVVGIHVLGHAHQAEAGERRGRGARHGVDVGRQLVPVVLAAPRDGEGGRLGQRESARRRHGAEDASVGHAVVVRGAAQFGRGDLLQLPHCVMSGGVVGARHGVDGLTAVRGTGPGDMLAGVAPHHRDVVPRHAEHVGGDARRVDDRVGAEVAGTGLHVQRAVGPDGEQAVVAHGVAADERTHRDADAADGRAVPHPAARLAFLPLEELGPLVERFAHERARDVAARAIGPRWPHEGLARGRVEAVQRQGVDAEPACRLRQNRLHDGVLLHAPR